MLALLLGGCAVPGYRVPPAPVPMERPDVDLKPQGEAGRAVLEALNADDRPDYFPCLGARRVGDPLCQRSFYSVSGPPRPAHR